MRKLITLFFLVVCSSWAVGQKKPPATELPSNVLDEKYTPPSSSIFNTSSAKGASTNNSGPVRSTLKFNVGLLARGVAASTFEFQIGKASSINLGLGFAFAKDPCQLLGLGPEGLDIDNGTSNSALSLYRILQNANYTNEQSLYGSFGLRIFPNYTGNLDGPYFEFHARFQNYSVNLAKMTYTNAGSAYSFSPFTVNVKNTSFAAIYGYQSQSSSGKFYNNLYMGVGLKQVSFDGVKDVVNTNSFGTSVHYLSRNSQTAQYFVPALIFGWEMGFGL